MRVHSTKKTLGGRLLGKSLGATALVSEVLSISAQGSLEVKG